MTKDRELTAEEIRTLRQQLNIAASRVAVESGWNPHTADTATAITMFETLLERFADANENTAVPMNGTRTSVHPAIAYLMHYVGGAAEGELTLIPDADTGILAAFGATGKAHQILTTTDPDTRMSLLKHLKVPEHAMKT